MKAYFDNFERIVFEPENKAEEIAIKYWLQANSIEPTPQYKAVKTENFLVTSAPKKETTA